MLHGREWGQGGGVHVRPTGRGMRCPSMSQGPGDKMEPTESQVICALTTAMRMCGCNDDEGVQQHK
jgi:hypothetical protein